MRHLFRLSTPFLLALVAVVFGRPRPLPSEFDIAIGPDVEYFHPGRHRAHPADRHVPEPGECEVSGPHATVRLPVPADIDL